MSRRDVKRKVLAILELETLDKVRGKIALFKPSVVINPLFSALCAVSDKTRHNAIAAFGVVVPALANEDMEAARVVMRRFLWSLNDESGGIGWGVPEAMAEVMACDERIAEEYLHMLLSYMREDGEDLFQDGNYLEMPMLQRGLLWGIARLCGARKELMSSQNLVSDLERYLDSEDGVVRGLALWCLCLLGDMTLKNKVLKLEGDITRFTVMQNGEMTELSTGKLVECYLSGTI